MSDKKLDRRWVLKTFGTAAAGLATSGVATAAADDQLDIRIWPQTGSDADVTGANNVFDSLASFLDDLWAENAVGSYSLEVENESINGKFGVSYNESECRDDSWFSDVRGKVTDAGFDDDVHVGVTDQINFAGADGGHRHDVEDEWPGIALVGTAGGWDNTNEDVERYKNAAIQEVGHVIIDETFIKDYETLEDPEHSLGHIKVTDWDNYTGPSTPMTVFYEEDPGYNGCDKLGEQASKGECGNFDAVEWDGTHTRELTSCTVQAVKDTHENRNRY